LAESLAPTPTVDVVVGQPSNTFKELTPPKPKPIVEAKTKNDVDRRELSPRQNVVKSSPEKKSSSNVELSSKSPIVPNASQTSLSKTGRLDLDDFIPDQNAIDNFLDDDFVVQQTFSENAVVDDDEDDEDENYNPMVAGFTDDLDLDDFQTSVVIHSSDDESAVVKTTTNNVEAEPKKVKMKSAKNLFNVPALASPQVELVSESNDDEPTKKKSKKKKSKKRGSKSPSRERDDLENFLNGSPESSQPRDATVYEAL
jgi:hypothetical protein